MNFPKVSIIMPSLNVVDYIQECMESVVNQTLKDIEIICVDAGSTDGTLEILHEYEAKDSRVKIILSDRKSYGYQMNLGMDAATGEYIGIVETDDYVKLDMYEKLFKIAETNSLDLIKADFYRFVRNDNGEETLFYNHLTDDISYYKRVINPKEELVIFTFIMNTWSGIYKNSFLKSNHIKHNETPGASFQDTGFWFQTFCYANKVFFLNEPLYMNRRDNPNSSVFNKSKIFCPCDEYDFIYSILQCDAELKNSFLPAYQYMRYKGYMASLNRSGPQHKLQFLKRFSQDFRFSENIGELDESMFTKGAKNTLHWIMRNPENYFAENCCGDEKEIQKIERTNFTLLQKTKEYYYEYGLKKTLSKIVEKIRRRKYERKS